MNQKYKAKHHICITFLLTFKSKHDIIILKKGEKKMEIRIENTDTPQTKNCYIDTEKTEGGLTMYFEVSGFPGEGDLRIRDAGGHIVDYSDYNMRYNDNVKEYILAAVSDYLDDIYKDLGRPQIDSPI